MLLPNIKMLLSNCCQYENVAAKYKSGFTMKKSLPLHVALIYPITRVLTHWKHLVDTRRDDFICKQMPSYSE